MSINKSVFSLLLSLSASLLLNCQAADTAWVGAIDNDWSKAGNWSVKVPAVGDVAYFTNASATVTLSGSCGATRLYVTKPLTLNVASGAVLELSNTGSDILTSVGVDVTINGPGDLKLSTSSGDNHADLRPATGTTLTIGARIIANDTAGVENNGAGKLVLTNPNNNFTGSIILTGTNGSLEFSDPAALGNAPYIIYSAYYTAIYYTGGTASMSQEIRVQTSTATGRDITFYHTGSGTLTINGDIDSTSNTGKAITFNVQEPTTEVAINGLVKNSTSNLYLYTSGKGVIRLNNNVNINGSVRADGGATMIFTDSITKVSSFTANAGSCIKLTGNVTIPNVAVTLGAVSSPALGPLLPGGRLELVDNAKSGTGALTMGAGSTLSLSDNATINVASIAVNTDFGALQPINILINDNGMATTYSYSMPTITINNFGLLRLNAKPATSGNGTLTINELNFGSMASANVAINAPALGSSATRIFANNLTEGAIAQNLFANGLKARYSTTDGIIAAAAEVPNAPSVTQNIPALGPYAISSDSTGTAAINSQGSGGMLTLGDTLTTLGALVQTWGADAAQLDLDGKTLATPLIQIAAGGNSLIITNGLLSAPGLPPTGEPPINQPAIVWLTNDASAGIDNSSGRIFTHLIDCGNQGQANAAIINGLTFTNIQVQTGTLKGTDNQTYGFSDLPPVYSGANWNNWTNIIPTTSTGLRNLMYDMNYSTAVWNFTLSSLTPGATYELRIFNRAWDNFPHTTMRSHTFTFISDPADPNPPTITLDQNNLPANMVVVRYVPSGTTINVRSTAAGTVSTHCPGLYGLSNEKISDSAVGAPAVTRVPTLALDNQNASATLAIDAAVSDNAGQLNILKSGGGAAKLNDYQASGDITILDGSLTINVASGTTNYLNGNIAGSSSAIFKKDGDGTMRLSRPNSFLGATTVEKGILNIMSPGALGSAATDLTVLPGAALALAGVNMADKRLVISGSGVGDGRGALYNIGARATGNQLFANIKLAGDVAIGGGTELTDFRNGTLDFDGHTITKVGADLLEMSRMTATNTATTAAIDVTDGILRIAENVDLKGSADNTITLRANKILAFYNSQIPVQWSLNLPDANTTAFVMPQNASGTNVNRIAGPVILGNDVTLAVTNAGSFANTFDGPISGNGKLVRTTGSQNETYLRATNSYTGTTEIYGGGLHAVIPQSLPGYDEPGRVINRSWLYAYTQGNNNPGGWSIAEIDKLHRTASFTGVSTFAWWLGDDITYPYDITVDSRLHITQPYTANITGNFTYPDAGNGTNGGLRASGQATVNVLTSQSNIYLGLLEADSGTINLTNNASTVFSTGTNYDINIKNGGVLNLAGNNTLVGHVKGYNTSSGKSLTVNDGKGVININDSAKLIGKLYLASKADQANAAAIYINGGTLHNTGGAGNDGKIGLNAHAYIELNSGVFTNNGYTQLGAGTNGTGIFRQNGGNFSIGGGTPTDTGAFDGYYNGSFSASRGGTGVIHVAGGRYFVPVSNHPGRINLGDNSDNSNTKGHSIMTIEGSAEVEAPFIDTANRTEHQTVLNLNGGELATDFIVRRNRTNNDSRINFNGTVWHSTQMLTDRVRPLLFGGDTAGTPVPMTGVDPLATVWPGGAIFDIPSNMSRYLAAPLLVPTGNGLQQVAIDAAGSGYIAPPHVTIFGGGGSGATAITQINRASGTVTNIIITSPGTGYTSNPTVALAGGGGSGATVKSVAIGPNPTTGGFTKLGAGTLTLAKGNTFKGPINVANGTLDLDGGTITNASVILSGNGSIVNGSLVASKIIKSGVGTSSFNLTPTLNARNSAAYGLTPGLYEGMLNTADDYTSPNPATSIQLTTRWGNGTRESNTTYNGGVWNGNNHTAVYSGYLWNRDATNKIWTFRGNFDDRIRLVIDGNTVISASGNNTATASYTLTPGPHTIDIRFGDGTGSVGPYSGLGGLTYDPQGRLSANENYYILMADPGDGSLFTVDDGGAYALSANAPAFKVEEGTLHLPANRPGLYEGSLGSVSSLDKTIANPATTVTLGTRNANAVISANTQWIYTGYIWNRSPTNEVWAFAESFDDAVYLKIDNTVVLDNAAWSTTTYNTINVAPGAHAIDLRVYNGTGGAGPQNQDDWGTTMFGVGIDRLGRSGKSSANYTPLIDPGDGSLLTLTADGSSALSLSGIAIEVAEGATLDLDGVAREGLTITGNGTIDNAVIGNGSVLSPAGDTFVGTLALGNVTFANNATYRLTVTPGSAANPYLAPGLYEGRISNRDQASVDWYTPNPCDSIQLETRYANTVIPSNTMYIYTGYIWNRASTNETWSFAESFDDGVMLVIDGQTVLSNQQWSVVSVGSITLAPGAHSFELRVVNGGGGAGPQNQDGWGTSSFGVGIDKLGRNQATSTYYQPLVDPGDGSLFTLSRDGSVNDLVNCTVGPVDLSKLTIVPANVASANPAGRKYTILHSSAGFIGGKPVLSGFDDKWKVYRSGNDLLLSRDGGTLIILR